MGTQNAILQSSQHCKDLQQIVKYTEPKYFLVFGQFKNIFRALEKYLYLTRISNNFLVFGLLEMVIQFLVSSECLGALSAVGKLYLRRGKVDGRTGVGCLRRESYIIIKLYYKSK